MWLEEGGSSVNAQPDDVKNWENVKDAQNDERRAEVEPGLGADRDSSRRRRGGPRKPVLGTSHDSLFLDEGAEIPSRRFLRRFAARAEGRGRYPDATLRPSSRV